MKRDEGGGRVGKQDLRKTFKICHKKGMLVTFEMCQELKQTRKGTQTRVQMCSDLN